MEPSLSRLQHSLGYFLDTCLGLIFQTTCPVCSCFTCGEKVCSRCLSLERLEEPICRRCGVPLSQPIDLCGHCLRVRQPVIEQVQSLLWLNNSSKAIIHQVKYQARLELMEVFRGVFKQHYQRFCPREASLVPVPIHSGKWIQRGFNQSERLAKWIAQRTGQKLLTGLMKNKRTPPQSTLSRSQRQKNLKGGFVWNSRIPPPRSVLIVDDIYTTGQTVLQCAKVLKRAGVEEIYAWTLFRTKSPR